MKRKKRDPVSRERLAEVLHAIQVTLGWKSNELARRMGVTPRTLVRWVHHRDMPAPARRVAMVAASRDLPADLVQRLALSLEVDPRVGGVALPTASAPAPDGARATLDAAVYAAADQLEVRAGDLRKALAPVLSAMEALGVDARTAREILDARRR
jgi:hypothetical protein